MAAHPPLMRGRFTRLPPSGESVSRAAIRALRIRDPARVIRNELQGRLGADVVTLHASGREALRVAFAQLARQSGRSEVVVPAYTCFSIAASAVAAGLRVRLVDVTLEGRIDPGALAKLPLEGVLALVVSNLLGVPEPLGPLRALTSPAGVGLVDDAAQSVGAGSAEGPVGGRGDVGLLSFGRGKPVSALGGGALAWTRRSSAPECPAPAAPSPVLALGRAVAYDLARVPLAFRALSAMPGLGIGETVYDPGFSRGAIDGASLCLAAALLPDLEATTRARRGRAERLAGRLREETRFVPLTANAGAYPRLGLIAPCASLRDRALAALTAFGATPLYRTPLDCIDALRPHRVGDAPCPGAHAFAARLLTLPTHASLRRLQVDEIVRTLERLA